MSTYQYHFVDAYEDVFGVVDAPDIAMAAVNILLQCGSEPNSPRWRRYGIRESSLFSVPPESEIVFYSRLNEYALDIRLAGTRKRKYLRVFA